jgi:hypothetical protein
MSKLVKQTPQTDLLLGWRKLVFLDEQTLAEPRFHEECLSHRFSGDLVYLDGWFLGYFSPP